MEAVRRALEAVRVRDENRRGSSVGVARVLFEERHFWVDARLIRALNIPYSVGEAREIADRGYQVVSAGELYDDMRALWAIVRECERVCPGGVFPQYDTARWTTSMRTCTGEHVSVLVALHSFAQRSPTFASLVLCEDAHEFNERHFPLRACDYLVRSFVIPPDLLRELGTDPTPFGRPTQTTVFMSERELATSCTILMDLIRDMDKKGKEMCTLTVNGRHYVYRLNANRTRPVWAYMSPLAPEKHAWVDLNILDALGVPVTLEERATNVALLSVTDLNGFRADMSAIVEAGVHATVTLKCGVCDYWPPDDDSNSDWGSFVARRQEGQRPSPPPPAYEASDPEVPQ